MGGIHGFAEKEETLIDVELVELPFAAASPEEVTEEVGDELKTFVRERLNSTPWKAYRHFTISRVPAQFREKNKALYEPAMVSIGPYYNGKKSLRTLEEHKWRFLKSFLAREKVPMAVLLDEMRAIEPLARRCYNESVSLGPDDFSLMLLLDGCFIIEYFIRLGDFDVFRVAEFNWSFESLQFDLLLLENQIPFFVIHKLFTLWLGSSQECENECPLCDLIFKCLPLKTKLSRPDPEYSCNHFRHLLQFYYRSIVPKTTTNPNPRQPPVVSRKERVVSWLKSRFHRQQTESSNPNRRQSPVVSRKERVVSWLTSRFYRQQTESSSPYHRQSQVVSRNGSVVSWLKSRFYHQQTESSSPYHRQSQVVSYGSVVSWLKSRFYRNQTEASPQKSFLGVIPCATRLHEYGVTFRKKDKPLNMFDITFKNGVLEMPYMDLNPYIRVLFRNLYAYEQNLNMSRGIFTSYTNLMDSLVNTEKDVLLLERCGIIDNMFQNEEEAATFFNELNDFGIIHRNHHFLDLFTEVQKYSESTWPRYRARLMHDYLSSPWSSISVFAGVVLLSLTVVQTIFTVYSAFHH
ncbi:hypothetical protein LUZ60_006689 [Juncus effusus]|nr:hypothetical protein LUZ60_006689 [Juncus effusus]